MSECTVHNQVAESKMRQLVTAADLQLMTGVQRRQTVCIPVLQQRPVAPDDGAAPCLPCAPQDEQPTQSEDCPPVSWTVRGVWAVYSTSSLNRQRLQGGQSD